jgi:MerR family transcriptional regulator, redox-sensitive transcriptional activator SoxR
MGIGAVASRAGVRPSALRYYERIGLLPTPERENGQRRYDGEVLREVLDRLAVVRVAQQAGFTISEIRPLLDGFSGGHKQRTAARRVSLLGAARASEWLQSQSI